MLAITRATARNTRNAFFGGPRARQCFLSTNHPATQCVLRVLGTKFVKLKHTKRPNLTLQSSACLRVLFPGTFGLCGCAGNAPKTASDFTVTARFTLSSSFLLARLRARSSLTRRGPDLSQQGLPLNLMPPKPKPTKGPDLTQQGLPKNPKPQCKKPPRRQI